jgi:hypothetical protein
MLFLVYLYGIIYYIKYIINMPYNMQSMLILRGLEAPKPATAMSENK